MKNPRTDKNDMIELPENEKKVNTVMNRKILIINNISLIFIFGLFAFSCTKEEQKVRAKVDFNTGWRFHLDDSVLFSETEYIDADWRLINLPHDWSIEGKFDTKHPAGTGGGALPGGKAWYRKSFSLPVSDSSKRIYITFDGVYHRSEVFINGQLLGYRPNGYIGFQYDLTDYLHFGEKSNLIAVKVDNSDQPNSRWYSGSGIYRNVWLEITNPIHIALWGTHITTSHVSKESAKVSIYTVVNNTTGKDENLVLETSLFDENNQMVASIKNNFNAKLSDTSSLGQLLQVSKPNLWSIEKPYLYKAVSTVWQNGHKIDTYETSFGIRFFDFDSKKGFSLNGKPAKILGVCNHHDLGALGAAVNTRAIERQLEILKEMGCNAIRTSHNPPAPELLDLCDKMGFIVMNETFDMWAKKKVEYDYSTIWNEWHVRDLTDHLLRDRNHPSVMMWSIGNEILEQWDSTGMAIATELTGLVHKYAPGIPVTSALNNAEPENFIFRSDALDLIGFNYNHETYEAFPDKFPGQKFIASETTSSLNSRGVYDMPADCVRIWPVRWDIPFYDGNPDQSCSSYDNCRTPWGSTHEDTWRIIKKHDFLAGMFIWTGFDYIGEPTPYQWPSRSSYFGIIDLAGFPKDSYYLYQSEWTTKPVLHLFPHWNWQDGQTVDVWAYSNFEEVELFVNEQSQGVQRKGDDDLHFAWKVQYKPGSIKAFGKNPDGSTMAKEIKTAGPASNIQLEADRSDIYADGKDLSFITVTVTDAQGVMVPNADNLIHFETDGMLRIAGVDNGSQTSHESFKANYRHAFNGKCLLIVQANNQNGKSIIKATSEGLKAAFTELELK
jgi:beta-galactosidase